MAGTAYILDVQSFSLKWERSVSLKQFLDQPKPVRIIGNMEGILTVTGTPSDALAAAFTGSGAWLNCGQSVSSSSALTIELTGKGYRDGVLRSSTLSVLGIPGLPGVIGSLTADGGQVQGQQTFLLRAPVSSPSLNTATSLRVSSITPVMALPRRLPLPGDSWYVPADRLLQVVRDVSLPPGELPTAPPADSERSGMPVILQLAQESGQIDTITVTDGLRVSGEASGEMRDGEFVCQAREVWLLFVDQLPG